MSRVATQRPTISAQGAGVMQGPNIPPALRTDVSYKIVGSSAYTVGLALALETPFSDIWSSVENKDGLLRKLQGATDARLVRC